MSKMIINVGIIDDDETKRTQIISNLLDGVEGAAEEIQEQYSGYELKPIELEILTDMDEMLEQIVENNINVLVVDYKLTSFENKVDYTGVRFAKRANSKFLDFPVFILTSFVSELYKHECFNAYQVFDFERYMDEEKEKIEINRKMIEQYLKHRNTIDEYKRELEGLLPRRGESEDIDRRILELDDFIERSYNGDGAIPSVIKKKLESEKFDTIISLLKELTQEEE